MNNLLKMMQNVSLMEPRLKRTIGTIDLKQLELLVHHVVASESVHIRSIISSHASEYTSDLMSFHVTLKPNWTNADHLVKMSFGFPLDNQSAFIEISLVGHNGDLGNWGHLSFNRMELSDQAPVAHLLHMLHEQVAGKTVRTNP